MMSGKCGGKQKGFFAGDTKQLHRTDYKEIQIYPKYLSILLKSNDTNYTVIFYAQLLLYRFFTQHLLSIISIVSLTLLKPCAIIPAVILKYELSS